jgi:hypothetical protein
MGAAIEVCHAGRGHHRSVEQGRSSSGQSPDRALATSPMETVLILIRGDDQLNEANLRA